MPLPCLAQGMTPSRPESSARGDQWFLNNNRMNDDGAKIIMDKVK